MLLIATTGITINKHYCLGELKSIAINDHAPHCYEGEDEKMPCCNESSQELKVSEITQEAFDFDSQPDLYELACTYFTILNIEFISTEEEQHHFASYSPPIADKDISILYQSFLI